MCLRQVDQLVNVVSETSALERHKKHENTLIGQWIDFLIMQEVLPPLRKKSYCLSEYQEYCP